MTEIVYIKLNASEDRVFIERVKLFGLRNLSRRLGYNNGHIARWLKGECGMAEHKFKAIQREIYGS